MAFTDKIQHLTLKGYVSATEAVRNFKKDEKGVTAVEYAIVIAGVAAFVAVIFGKDGTVATMLNNIFSDVTAKVSNSMGQ
ncbi:Flp family type IVb pilin [Edaphovirga cremea]|uniref:Flp family type IVb pilin n=1 Tax=Edaphovirga cremea TaxID=2267246 RepID=UPI000DEF5120|nr:Flp family type IVb pilin [Edaphovirga cremea]